MKIAYRGSKYDKQHHEIKTNGVLRAKLQDILLIVEYTNNEYILSDNDIGYVVNLNDRSATDFYNDEFDLLIASNHQVLEICVNTIAPYLTERDGQFLVNAIIEIPYTIEGITVIEDDKDDVVYNVEDVSIMIHDIHANILKLKIEEAY